MLSTRILPRLFNILSRQPMTPKQLIGFGHKQAAPDAKNHRPSALDALYKGNQNFVSGHDPRYFQQLSAVHRPQVFYLGCSDARAPINELTGIGPGDLLIERNPGAFAAFGTRVTMSLALQLGVRNFMVCGHQNCGAVAMACEIAKSRDFNRYGKDLGQWLKPLVYMYYLNQKTIASLPSDEKRHEFLTVLHTRSQLATLMGFDFVHTFPERLYFDAAFLRLETGRLECLDHVVG